MDGLNVTFRLQRLRCLEEADGAGAAEPYMWVMFFKLDGETLTVDSDAGFKVKGQAVSVSMSGNHGDLGDRGVNRGDVVAIPAQLGAFDTVLMPIPLTKQVGQMTHVGGAIGCIAVLLEQDATPSDAILAGHNKLAESVTTELAKVIDTLGPGKQSPSDEEIAGIISDVTGAVTRAVRNAVNGLAELLRNSDDLVGAAVLLISQAELASAGRAGLDLRHRWIQRLATLTPVSQGFGSSSTTVLRPGRYNRVLSGITSVQLPPGWRLLTFPSSNFQGTPHVLDRSGAATGARSFIIDQGEVVFFDQPDFGGRQQAFTEPGRHDGQDTALASFGDNRLASLRVPPGWRVTVFREKGFVGQRAVFDRDTPRLPANLAGQVSSAILEREDNSSADGEYELEAHITGIRRISHLPPVTGTFVPA